MSEKNHKIHHYLKITDDTVDVIKKPVYIWSILILHICYFLVFIGIVSIDSGYLNYINIFIQSFIAIFLMYRFFPFRTHYLRDFDPQIIFACGMFLLLNTFAVEISRFYIFFEKGTDGVKNKVFDWMKKI